MTLRTVARNSCAAAFALLTGCALITDPGDRPRVSLVLRQTDEVGFLGPSAEVQASDVVLRGLFSTPCLGYTVTAGAKQRRGTVEITLRGRQQGEGCLTAIGRLPYTATVSGVKSGTQRVIVQHLIENANWPATTVVDTILRIP